MKTSQNSQYGQILALSGPLCKREAVPDTFYFLRQGIVRGGIEMEGLDFPIVITPTLTLPPQEGEWSSRGG